jgi:hypothetical protein
LTVVLTADTVYSDSQHETLLDKKAPTHAQKPQKTRLDKESKRGMCLRIVSVACK